MKGAHSEVFGDGFKIKLGRIIIFKMLTNVDHEIADALLSQLSTRIFELRCGEAKKREKNFEQKKAHAFMSSRVVSFVFALEFANCPTELELGGIRD